MAVDQDYLDDILDELEGCENVQEMLDVLSDAYILEDCKLGTIAKGKLIAELEKVIKKLNPEPRE